MNLQGTSARIAFELGLRGVQRLGSIWRVLRNAVLRMKRAVDTTIDRLLDGDAQSKVEFRLLRYFSAVSGIVFLVLTIACVFLYRDSQYTILKSDAQDHNINLAQTIANSIWMRYSDYLAAAGQLSAGDLLARPETQDLNTELRLTTSRTPTLKLKIYAPNGLLIFSPEFGEIGTNVANEPTFKAVLDTGLAAGTVKYHGKFVGRSSVMSNVAVLKSSVPVFGGDGKVRAVFELYTDFSPQNEKISTATWQVASGIVAGFVGLYLLLYLLVARADNIMGQQRSKLADLNADLERRVASRTSQLRLANEEIAAFNASLEARVQERTEALSQAHEDLNRLNIELARRLVDLKEAQDQIIKKGKLAQLGQLTATVAHEIRNPLGAIKTSVQLIERKLQGQSLGLEKSLERINNGVRRCDYIITELLDFARSKALVLKDHAIDEWLASVLDEEAPNIPSQVRVSCGLGLKGQSAVFDADRMRRVIVNLVSNAVEAMVGKGSERVAGLVQDPCIEIATRFADGNIEIAVTDNGPGISEDNFKKILEPLFTTKSFGIGLGLSAVEKILQLHGGGLRVTSVLGHGATFVAWFPVVAAERQAA